MTNLITGRVWVLTDADGKMIENIDTDMIFHNRYLHITEVSEMGQYTFDNLAGWEDFAEKAKPGDLVVVGSNFGCGSSRQGAVDCFRDLGIQAIVAVSYGAIYFRNAVNVGFPVLACAAITPEVLTSGEQVSIDITNATWLNDTRDKQLPALLPISSVQREIITAGGLFELKV